MLGRKSRFHADAPHSEGAGGSASVIGWHAPSNRIMYSLKLTPLRVALQRARHQMGSGMALTCRSRVPFRVPDAGVMASVSVFIRLASVVDKVMIGSWRERH